MKMNQSEAIAHFVLFKNLNCFKNLTRCKAKLTGITTRIFPLSASRARKLHSNTNIRFYFQSLSNLQSQFQLIQFLNYKKNLLAHLFGKQCQFNVTLVLIPITDYQRVVISINSQNSMEFRLRSRFQSYIIFFATRYYLLNHLSHLIHLNRVNYMILCLIIILLRSFSKTLRYLLNSVIKNFRKTK